MFTATLCVLIASVLGSCRAPIPNLPLGNLPVTPAFGDSSVKTHGRQNLIITRISGSRQGSNGIQIAPGPGYRIPIAMGASHDVESGGTGGESAI